MPVLLNRPAAGNRRGVEIDYCPHCRGVWLDRGELDKIVERSSRYDEVHDPEDAELNQDRPRDHHTPAAAARSGMNFSTDPLGNGCEKQRARTLTRVRGRNLFDCCPQST
jgi:Zn-finger nucleic acid-binding protein